MRVFVCPICMQDFSEEDHEGPVTYYDDDENENGEHLWQVPLTCPFCGEEFCEEFWE